MTMDGTIAELMTPGRGILAADESHATIAARFEALGITPDAEHRRRYRQMLFTTPGIAQYISGVILFDETLGQRADDGQSFVAMLAERNIVPGIKVDAGTSPLAGAPGESITEGLDGLRERLADYRARGARFAKWRAVIRIGGAHPSARALDANAHALARYAALCQELGLVPIVEPEVLLDGAHSLERTFDVTETTLVHVFAALRAQGVMLEMMLLKPNMVLPGTDGPPPSDVREVADSTVRCLRQSVPAAVPGIVFLSGGQDPQLATARLNAMNVAPAAHPWPLGFSFARALQTTAMTIWRGDQRNEGAAQRAFLHRARCNGAARDGRYTPELEGAAGASPPPPTTSAGAA